MLQREVERGSKPSEKKTDMNEIKLATLSTSPNSTNNSHLLLFPLHLRLLRFRVTPLQPLHLFRLSFTPLHILLDLLALLIRSIKPFKVPLRQVRKTRRREKGSLDETDTCWNEDDDPEERNESSEDCSGDFEEWRVECSAEGVGEEIE